MDVVSSKPLVFLLCFLSKQLGNAKNQRQSVKVNTVMEGMQLVKGKSQLTVASAMPDLQFYIMHAMIRIFAFHKAVLYFSPLSSNILVTSKVKDKLVNSEKYTNNGGVDQGRVNVAR